MVACVSPGPTHTRQTHFNLGQVKFGEEAQIGMWESERYRDLNSALPACITILIYRLVTSLPTPPAREMHSSPVTWFHACLHGDVDNVSGQWLVQLQYRHNSEYNLQ